MQNNLNNLEIGERIRSVREDMFMSREKFSEMIDISDVFLGQIERGERSLSLKTLTNITSYTGVSADYFLFGNDSENSDMKKINRMLKKSSPDTLEFVYNLIHSIYAYNKTLNNAFNDLADSVGNLENILK